MSLFRGAVSVEAIGEKSGGVPMVGRRGGELLRVLGENQSRKRKEHKEGG